MDTSNRSIFQRQPWVVVFALTAAIAWGWAYPLIKLGFAQFHITPAMTGSKMLFAGIRFAVSGLIILLLARASHRRFAARTPRDWLYILAFTLFNTTLHYAFFYFGLSHSEGSRAAIINSLSVFAVVIFACFFFKTDRMTVKKVAGCVVGIIGILALNMGDKDSGRFTWSGDGMIILNALCGAVASLMTRGLSRRIDVFTGTGYSLAIGGILLMIPGLMVGGTLPVVTLSGIVILLLLINEGMAREIINRIQNLRKDSGLEITDRIKVVIAPNEQTNAALAMYGEYIKGQVLADDITIADNDGVIEKFDVNITIEKV